MDFEKRLKTRRNVMISYMAIGVVLIALNLLKLVENEYFLSLGITLAFLGFLKLLQYRRITKDEESIRKRRIAETDERNIANSHKAKSAAFGGYVIIAGVSVIVLEIIGEKEYSKILAFSVCSLVFLYWISYFFYSKKS